MNTFDRLNSVSGVKIFRYGEHCPLARGRLSSLDSVSARGDGGSLDEFSVSMRYIYIYSRLNIL